eukprot:1615701-Pyramimonas_sp.AAC.1
MAGHEADPFLNVVTYHSIAWATARKFLEWANEGPRATTFDIGLFQETRLTQAQQVGPRAWAYQA